jgi:hypothetical protein
MLSERSSSKSHPASRRVEARRGVDGLIVGSREVWLVVAHGAEDLEDLLTAEPDEAPLRLCRAVLDDDELVLGDADPERDAFLSDILLTRKRSAEV